MRYNSNRNYMHLVELLREKYALRNRRVKQLLEQQDAAGILRRGARLREALSRHLTDGDIPAGYRECIPAGVLECGGYRIEKQKLRMATGLTVPVNVYVPLDGKPRHGAVLVTMGHWLQAKAMEENQRFCANLALRGLMAITYDPIYQGERCPCSREKLDAMFGPITEDMQMVGLHMLAGNPAYLLKRNLAALFTCEAMAVTDYLLSRPDVDSDLVIAAGQSGGGTQAMYLAAMDQRIKGVIPIQCLSRLSITLEGGIGDCEQSFLGISAEEGTEQGDLLWAVLPKPVFHSAGRDDFFSLEGVLEIEREMTAVYETLGKPEDYRMALADCGHSLTRQGREQIYGWLSRRWGAKDLEQEAETPVFAPEALGCLASFEEAGDPLTVYKAVAVKMADRRSRDPGAIRSRLKALIDPRGEIPGGMECGSSLRKGSDDTLYVYVGTGEAPFGETSGNVLTLVPWGLEIARDKATQGYDLESCMFNAAGVLGINFCAVRVRQIIRAVEQALAQTGAKTVRAYGEGAGATALLLAAAVGEIPMELTLEGGLGSWMELFEPGDRILRETEMIPGIPEITDLPCLRELVGGKESLWNS